MSSGHADIALSSGARASADALDLLRTLLNGAPPTQGAKALFAAASAPGAETSGLDKGLLRLRPLMAKSEALVAGSPATRHKLRAVSLRLTAQFATLERQAALLASALSAKGIPALFLKGFPLAAAYYSDQADRPMGDLDIAVPGERFDAAADVLAELGLLPDAHDAAARPGVNTHAMSYRQPRGAFAVDLHCNLLGASLWTGADDGFWQRAVPLALTDAAGQPVDGALTLCAEDLLVHTCLHSYSRPQTQSLIRWIPDAVIIIRRAGDALDWEIVIAEAERQRCGPALAASLAYLVAELSVPIPDTVLDRLRQGTAHFYDIGYFRTTPLRADNGSPLLRLQHKWFASQRQANKVLWSPLAFARVLAWHWGASSLTGLVTELLRRRREPEALKSARSARKRQGDRG